MLGDNDILIKKRDVVKGLILEATTSFSFNSSNQSVLIFQRCIRNILKYSEIHSNAALADVEQKWEVSMRV